MNEKLPVVTLCGSMRFQKEFLEAGSYLTTEGYVVLGAGILGANFDEGFVDISDNLKFLLKRAMMQKIDMSDELFVVNKDGYIGETTKEEIAYAEESGKNISYMFINCPQDCWRNSECQNCAFAHKHHKGTIFQHDNTQCPTCYAYSTEDK